MPNRLRGEVEITVGGETLALRPTFDAICRIEDEIGKILPLVSQMDNGELGVRQQVGVLHRCSDGSRSEDEMGQWIIENGGVNDVRVAVYQLLTAMVTGGKEPEKNPKAPVGQKKSTGASTAK